MRKDVLVSYDGLTAVTKGVDSSAAPVALPRNQLSWAVNIEARTDFLKPRNGLMRRILLFPSDAGVTQSNFQDQIFQGAIVFERMNRIVTMIGGRLFDIKTDFWNVTDVTPVGDANPNNLYRAWFCEVENWIIAQDGISIPLIYDGASAYRSDTLGAGGKAQVPIGKAMVYSQGRLNVAYSNGREFVIGDIVNGDSGTPAYGFKDSVLYFTENDVINGGGSFSVPMNAGLITAFRPVAQVDTSTGQGPTQVFTTNAIFSMDLPSDRTTWATTNQPIGTFSNIHSGAMSDRCTANVNGDIWFRALDGIRSFLVARRDFGNWVNAPLSNEVGRAIKGDDLNLLGYASDSAFDNRLLHTVRPYRVWGHGIVHQGMISLDFQPVTALSDRSPVPTWLGNVTGLRVLQVLTGIIRGVQRCFIFALNSVDEIELWEVTTDMKVDMDGVTIHPIEWAFETGSFTFTPDATGSSSLPGRELWELVGGRLYVDEIDGNVTFSLQYRCDQDPCWHDWHSWQVCANNATCGTGTDCIGVPPNLRSQYRKPFYLPRPGVDCDTTVNKPLRIGREFQVRVQITGWCRVKMLELRAAAMQEDVTGICAGNEVCASVICCPPNDYSYYAN